MNLSIISPGEDVAAVLPDEDVVCEAETIIVMDASTRVSHNW